jgi:hypothetical protein
VATDRTVYRVHPDRGWWKVTKNQRKIDVFDLQEAAIARGREMAKADQPSQLVVHGKDGTIEDEVIYEDDPFPTRG